MATELIVTLAGSGVRTALDALILVAGALVVERLLARRLWPELRGALFAAVVVRLWWPPGLESVVAPGAGGALGVGSLPALPALDPGVGFPRLLLGGWAVGVVLVLFLRWRRRFPIAAQTFPAEGPVLAAFSEACRIAGLRRVPGLRMVHGRGAPCLVATRRPIVVVPAAFPATTTRTDLVNVLVHELCHLLQHNHSPAYYKLLDRALPDWRARKKRLNAAHLP